MVHIITKKKNGVTNAPEVNKMMFWRKKHLEILIKKINKLAKEPCSRSRNCIRSEIHEYIDTRALSYHGSNSYYSSHSKKGERWPEGSIEHDKEAQR